MPPSSSFQPRFPRSGPGTGYYGASPSLSWLGGTGKLATCERNSHHECLYYDTAVTPCNRTVSNASQGPFTRLRVVPGGSGGDMIRGSKGNYDATGNPLVLWRHRSSSTAVQTRAAPSNTLTGRGRPCCARTEGVTFVETT